MTPEQLEEIEKLALDGAFKAAGYYALPLVKALREALGDRDDTLAVLARVAESLDVSAEALAEDPSVAIRSARGSVRELREIAERNAANAQHLRATAIEAERERDEARSEAAEIRKKRNADLLALEKAMDASAEGSWMARALDAERERDEASEELIAASRAIEQLKTERDEARAEAKQLREIVKTAGDRLRACAHQLTEHAYQEMADALFDLPAAAEVEP